jgi:tetratricopeptide (TPR) repeat protein
MKTFELVQNKILKPEEIVPFKDYFFELLQNTNDNVYDTWSYSIDELVKSKILTLKESIFFYDKALEIDAKNTDALNGKGAVYGDLKQYDEALKYYNKALEIDPRYINTLNDKASTLAEIGRNDEAFSLIEKEVISNPTDEYLQSTMAYILYNLGKIKDAKLYYEKSLNINPNLTEILTEKELPIFNKLMNNNNITKQ